MSNDPDLFDHVRASLRADSRFIDAGDTLHCDSSVAPLTNIYPTEVIPAEWEDWGSASDLPDPRTMTLLIFECRSPEWVAEVGELLAKELEAPVWFLDSIGTAWPAGQVDPARVVLA